MRRSLILITLGTLAAFASIPALAQRIEPLRQDRQTPVVKVFQTARNAVVNISSTRIVKTGMSMFGGLDEDPFDSIFMSPFTRDVPVQSLGSGFIIHGDGYIVTNEHVVKQAMKISIITADGKSHDADIIATDARHDLAILKMAPPDGKELPSLPLGRSDDLLIGETVIAIGNPKGYQHSVTAGIISALDRELNFGKEVRYSGLIQTDAPINPGNSGGPLLNVDAQVIGINTAIRPDAQGIGFAISIDDFTKVLPSLLDVARLHRVVSGMTIEQQRRSGQNEVVVAKVGDGGPAAKAGLKAGHIVKRVDDQDVATLADYYVCMLGKRAGQELQITTAAGDKEEHYTVHLVERPRPDGAALAKKRLGLALRPNSTELAGKLNLATDKGLVVTKVAPEGAAERCGVRVRDIVFQLGQGYVNSLEDLGSVLEDVSAGQTMRIGVVRGRVLAWGDIETGDSNNPAQPQPQPQKPEKEAPDSRIPPSDGAPVSDQRPLSAREK